MQMNERKIIIEHVLENKENLEMALDIISLTPEIHSCIIKTFLGELKVFICEELDKLDMSQWKWETELYNKPYGGKKNRIFGVSSKFGVLQEPVGIALAGKPPNGSFDIGVFSSPTNELCNEPMKEYLQSHLKTVFKSGRYWESESEIWIWYQSLKKPSDDWDYTDWTNKHTLIKMQTETDRVVKHIGNHLLDIIKEVKSVIDARVEQNPATL